MCDEVLRCPGRQPLARSRREFLKNSSMGFGWLAFSQIAGQALAVPSQKVIVPQAKRVIFLFMDGGVSHVDTFDPKPELDKRHGQPAKWRIDTRSQAVSANRKWLKSPWAFQQRGESGLWVSNLFPEVAEVADNLCVIRSMVGENPLHGAQSLLLHPGDRLELHRVSVRGSRTDWGRRTSSCRDTCC